MNLSALLVVMMFHLIAGDQCLIEEYTDKPSILHCVMPPASIPLYIRTSPRQVRFDVCPSDNDFGLSILTSYYPSVSLIKCGHSDAVRAYQFIGSELRMLSAQATTPHNSQIGECTVLFPLCLRFCIQNNQSFSAINTSMTLTTTMSPVHISTRPSATVPDTQNEAHATTPKIDQICECTLLFTLCLRFCNQNNQSFSAINTTMSPAHNSTDRAHPALTLIVI